MKEQKCLYCDNLTSKPHFQSGCCERGMCDDCYDGLVGTTEQLQIDFCDNETYEQFSKQIDEIESKGYGYICYEHMIKN